MAMWRRVAATRRRSTSSCGPLARRESGTRRRWTCGRRSSAPDRWPSSTGVRSSATCRARGRSWTEQTVELSQRSSRAAGHGAARHAHVATRIVALRDRILRALQRGGARLLLGADSPQVYSVPGFSLAHEMRAMVEAGLPTYAVLEAATRTLRPFSGRRRVRYGRGGQARGSNPGGWQSARGHPQRAPAGGRNAARLLAPE